MSNTFCKPLTELARSDFLDVPAEAGVYVVFWARSGKPVAIPRIRGLDERGVLYIGSTAGRRGLRKRIRSLWISIQVARGSRKRRKYPHTLGASLAYTGLHEMIADHELCVCFKVFSDQDARH
ncbi:MAG: hypothetical protein ACP5KA_07430, partial [Desulfurococcaceae archaeon]